MANRRPIHQSAATGSFVVTNELAPTSASADFQIQSPVTYSVTPSQPTYPVWSAGPIDAHGNQPFESIRRGGANPASFTGHARGKCHLDRQCERHVSNIWNRNFGAGTVDHAIRDLGRHNELAGSTDRSLGNLRRIQPRGTGRHQRSRFRSTHRSHRLLPPKSRHTPQTSQS